jgi:Spy/CpxP family protein refolding chaperone
MLVREKQMRKLAWMFVAFIMSPLNAFSHSPQMPYAGHEKRAMKTLSDEYLQALLNGQGMGLAKAAELNHYPGPRHVLDLAAQLELSAVQRAETQQIYDRMHQEAVRLGTLIVDKEQELDQLFATQTVHADTLRNLTKQIAQLQGDLRLVHLQAHVEMKQVLSGEQIDQYDVLRGYTGQAGPAPPSGHHSHH